jgi:hypothetical protein
VDYGGREGSLSKVYLVHLKCGGYAGKKSVRRRNTMARNVLCQLVTSYTDQYVVCVCVCV